MYFLKGTKWFKSSNFKYRTNFDIKKKVGNLSEWWLGITHTIMTSSYDITGYPLSSALCTSRSCSMVAFDLTVIIISIITQPSKCCISPEGNSSVKNRTYVVQVLLYIVCLLWYKERLQTRSNQIHLHIFQRIMYCCLQDTDFTKMLILVLQHGGHI
jgi:hypothetical protein